MNNPSKKERLDLLREVKASYNKQSPTKKQEGREAIVTTMLQAQTPKWGSLNLIYLT